MEPLKIKTRDEEAKIQQAIIKELRFLLWYVKETHGNMYQSGLPDLYCCHKRYGARWVECKAPHRTGYSAFTPAQLENFPHMTAAGANIWVATTHIGIQELLMKPANWHLVLLGTKGV